MPLRIGNTFAGYRVLRLLGSGGMGEVYLVQHPRLPRQEALKILRHDVSSDLSFRERFIREADLAAGLRHPHIVAIHDRGEHDGQLWIAMDYIDGTDAGHLLEQKYPAGMPTDLVMRITTAVASALDYAHKKGLLHRDVKPANIIVADLDTDEPTVFLADFGIARPLDDTSGITTTNMTVGTVAYASPEQLMGEPMDGRADQYALAATTYNLLTGSQLFPNSNPAVVISRHLNAPAPALANIRPELASLDPVLAAALAKSRDDRFACCQDFAREFATATVAGPGASPTAPTQESSVAVEPVAPPGGRRYSLVWAAVAVVIVLGLLTVGVTLWRPWANQGDRVADPSTTSSVAITVSTAPTTTPMTSAPPPVSSTSSPPRPPQPTTPSAPEYPPAGALGEWCDDPNGIGTGPSGTPYYCARMQYTDGYQWSLTPDDIPNPDYTPRPPTPPSEIDPSGPSAGYRCNAPGAIVRGTLGLTECKWIDIGNPAFTGWFWALT
ncbi:serine/threonine-protein kinase [Mycolicibacterium hippocampi]|uniref:non-specific serine/threonine protein kinase n=1 Tax=Mycolicibacterium hippocampi TaxID=659824 RepID=A0A7I9ZQM4_9MYCO|nr:serine/threonine-protein kinase [Mycolicibacterium hippocampi]GFH02988.1 hypothetical protein MHIP_34710 [Mycolicibacterium hippocampi]